MSPLKATELTNLLTRRTGPVSAVVPRNRHADHRSLRWAALAAAPGQRSA